MFKSKCPKCNSMFRDTDYKYHKEHYKWYEFSSGDIHYPNCGVKLDIATKGRNARRVVTVLILIFLGFTFLSPENPFYLPNSIIYSVLGVLLVLDIVLPEKYIIKE